MQRAQCSIPILHQSVSQRGTVFKWDLRRTFVTIDLEIPFAVTHPQIQ